MEPERVAGDPRGNSACTRDAHHDWRDALGIFSRIEPVATRLVAWAPEAQPIGVEGFAFRSSLYSGLPTFVMLATSAGFFPERNYETTARFPTCLF